MTHTSAFLLGAGKTLFVCEAAIDAPSIATLRKFDGLDWKKDNYLALGGVTASECKLPAALERTLNTFSFKWVVLCFDNDAAGQTAARRIFTMLRQRYPEKLEVKCCVPNVKDFNDQLCVKLQNGKNPPFTRDARKHFITLKVNVPASIGFWIAKIRLVKGIPPK